MPTHPISSRLAAERDPFFWNAHARMADGNLGLSYLSPGADPRPQLREPRGIDDSLVRGRIETRYQPIVRLSDGALATMEVLARLQDPTLGLIQPDIFVPLIEQAGFSEQLMKAVLTSGLREVAGMAALPGHVPAAFNLPLEMVLRPEALHWMDDRRARLGLSTDDVAVELTESHPVGDLPALAQALERWTRAGYRMSIDDVTPALPNHRALLDLPFHYAKLDKSVTRISASSPMMAEFLAAFVAAAQLRGKQVIAEGIESAEDWRRMRALGIDLAQGFLIALPLPVREMSAWIAASGNGCWTEFAAISDY